MIFTKDDEYVNQTMSEFARVPYFSFIMSEPSNGLDQSKGQKYIQQLFLSRVHRKILQENGLVLLCWQEGHYKDE